MINNVYFTMNRTLKAYMAFKVAIFALFLVFSFVPPFFFTRNTFMDHLGRILL